MDDRIKLYAANVKNVLGLIFAHPASRVEVSQRTDLKYLFLDLFGSPYRSSDVTSYIFV
jgi:hypothetical protein